MTCRCTSPAMHESRRLAEEAQDRRYEKEAAAKEKEAAAKKAAALEKRLYEMSPDNTRFEVLDAVQDGPYLIMKVQYPNCAKCSYEGIKVMVFEDVTAFDALKWKVLDPHFRDPNETRSEREAPPPVARFPANERGWQDALSYASPSR